MSARRLAPVLALGALLIVGLWATAPMANRPQLTVYTAHSQDALDLLIPHFQRVSGAQVDVVKGGSGELLQRLQAEADRPRCDVVWSVAGELLQAHAALFEPLEVDASLDPELVLDPRWQPYSQIMPVFLVDTRQFNDDSTRRPTRWTDLGHADLHGQVASARATQSGSAYMQLQTVLQRHPERGWEVYAQIARNLRLTPSSSAVCRLVADGEVPVGITLEATAARYAQGGEHLQVVYPADGTTRLPDGVAAVAGAPHPQLAAQFVRWALSPEVQTLLATELLRRAVRTDVPPPVGLPPLRDVQVAPYDLEAAVTHREATLQRWQELIE